MNEGFKATASAERTKSVDQIGTDVLENLERSRAINQKQDEIVGRYNNETLRETPYSEVHLQTDILSPHDAASFKELLDEEQRVECMIGRNVFELFKGAVNNSGLTWERVDYGVKGSYVANHVFIFRATLNENVILEVSYYDGTPNVTSDYEEAYTVKANVLKIVDKSTKFEKLMGRPRFEKKFESSGYGVYIGYDDETGERRPPISERTKALTEEEMREAEQMFVNLFSTFGIQRRQR